MYRAPAKVGPSQSKPPNAGPVRAVDVGLPESFQDLLDEGALTLAAGPRDRTAYRGPPLPKLPLTSEELAELDREDA